MTFKDKTKYLIDYILCKDYQKCKFVSDIHKCARCGKDHKRILVYELLNPTDNHKYFTTCPSTKQPLFIEVVP